MPALSIPKKLAARAVNKALCARIGVKVDGEDMGKRVLSYDVDAGAAVLNDGSIKRGKIEPYWR